MTIEYKMINNSMYWKEKTDKFWKPDDIHSNPGRYLFVCDCGGKTFMLFYPQMYALDAECVGCGHCETVYEG